MNLTGSNSAPLAMAHFEVWGGSPDPRRAPSPGILAAPTTSPVSRLRTPEVGGVSGGHEEDSLSQNVAQPLVAAAPRLVGALTDRARHERGTIPAGNVSGGRNLDAAPRVFPMVCAEVSGKCRAGRHECPRHETGIGAFSTTSGVRSLGTARTSACATLSFQGVRNAG